MFLLWHTLSLAGKGVPDSVRCMWVGGLLLHGKVQLSLLCACLSPGLTAAGVHSAGGVHLPFVLFLHFSGLQKVQKGRSEGLVRKYLE